MSKSRKFIKKNELKLEEVSQEIENYITLPTKGKYYKIKGWNEKTKKCDGEIRKNKYNIPLYDNKITSKYYEKLGLIFDKNPIYENKNGDKSIKITCYYNMYDYLNKYNNKINIQKNLFKNNIWWKIVDPNNFFEKEVVHSDISESDSDSESESE